MVKDCDHRSVGVVIRNQQGRVLLIERGREPWGWACVSGHVDEDADKEGVHWDAAARREVQEEVGLKLKHVWEVAQGRKKNVCRRNGGDWHYWVIFEAESDGEITIEPSEVKRYVWADSVTLQVLNERTKAWLSGQISMSEWRENPG